MISLEYWQPHNLAVSNHNKISKYILPMLLRSPEISNTLAEFGLSGPEIRVYLAALALGPRPATIIAQKAGLKRGTVYNVLTNLMERGIMQEFLRGNVRHFTCSPPTSLFCNLEHRVNQLEVLKNRLKDVLPELEQIRNPLVSAPKVRYFQGSEGIKEAQDELLTAGQKEIHAVFDLKNNWTTVDDAPYDWVELFIKRRVELGIWYLGIVNQFNTDDYIIKNHSSQLRKLKLVEGVDFPAEIMICGAKVVAISATREKVGIIIENEAIAETLRNLHVTVWSLLPEYF